MAEFGKSLGKLPVKQTFGKRLSKDELKIILSSPQEGAISEKLAQRHQPTRLEQIIGKVAPQALEYEKFKRGYLPKGMPYAGEPLPRPTKSRLAGRAIDIPIDIAKAIPEMSKAYARSKFLPPAERLKQAGGIVKGAVKEIGTGMLTTATHPAASFREAPLETAGDVYIGGQLVKGVAKGVPALAKGAGKGYRALRPKKSFYTVGKDLEEGLKEVRKVAGKAVGAEKEAVRGIKVNVDTKKVITEMNNSVSQTYTGAGGTALSKGDINAIEDITKSLAINKANPTPGSLINTKAMIDKYIKYGKPAQGIPKVEGPAQAFLMKARGQVDDLLKQADRTFGNGNWTKVNAKYAKVAKLNERARGLIGGEDVRLQSKMGTVGKRIVEGDEGYISLFEDIQKEVRGLSPKYGGAIDDLKNLALAKRGGSKLIGAPLLGTSLGRIGGGAKDIAQLYGRRTGRFWGGLSKRIPTSKIGITGAAIPLTAEALRQR